jgi:aspartyl/glutamyl-tRNA(Asn/Gln) amidotransferase C subunit
MISKEEVKHIAKLARLELTEKEIEKMQKDMSAILDYFDLLKKVKGPESQLWAGDPEERSDEGQLRKDEVISSHDIVDELISAIPDKKDDYIKVKSIL